MINPQCGIKNACVLKVVLRHGKKKYYILDMQVIQVDLVVHLCDMKVLILPLI